MGLPVNVGPLVFNGLPFLGRCKARGSALISGRVGYPARSYSKLDKI